MPFLILFLCMVLSGPQVAAINEVNLSLEEAVAVAFDHEPGLKLLKEQRQSARASTLIESAWPAAEAGVSVEGIGFTELAKQNDP